MPKFSKSLIFSFLTFTLLLTACVDEQTIREFEALVQTEEAAALATEQAVNVQPPISEATRTPRPATSVPPTRPASTGGGSTTNPNEQTWTILLYQNANDEVLEQDIFIDLNEAEAIGSTDRVKIVSRVEPGLGWAYAAFLNDLVNKPEMDGRELSQKIVEHYITNDLRIVNDQAREDYTGRRVSAQAVINATAANATPSAIDGNYAEVYTDIQVR